MTSHGSMFHMEDLPKPFHQLEERLSREDSCIENISIFPLKMVSLSSFFKKVNNASEIGQCNIFPMVTSKIRMVRARTKHRETMIHTTFLKELIHKLTIGQIKLRTLDLRGMEVLPSQTSSQFHISVFIFFPSKKVALVGPNGRDTMREQLTKTGTKLLYDEEKLEKEHTW